MVETGSAAFGSTGATSILLNNITGVPQWIQCYTGGKVGTNETTNARNGAGAAVNDGSNGVDYQWATASLVNANGKYSRNYPGTYAFVVLDSTGAEVVKGKVTGFAAGQINVQLDAASSLYDIFFVCGD